MSDEFRIACVLKTKAGAEFSRLDLRRSPLDRNLVFDAMDLLRITCERADIHTCDGTITIAQGERRLVVTVPRIADAAGLATARESIEAFLCGETAGVANRLRLTAAPTRDSAPPPRASGSMLRASVAPPPASSRARPSRGAK